MKMDYKMDFVALRKQFLEKEFFKMNDMQKAAVFHVNGSLLILAGAGSGKTTVIVNRIVNLVKYGNAYNSEELPFSLTQELYNELNDKFISDSLTGEDKKYFAIDKVKPWQILAITFTNKAAGELKSRINNYLSDIEDEIMASTFHSFCARVLRRYADRLGYSNQFTIYDMDDCKRLVKECLKVLNLDEKMYPIKSVMSDISKNKDTNHLSGEINDFRKQKIKEIYDLYQKRLKESDAMDFDDLLLNTVNLLENNEDVLEYYQRRFKNIMVDEYQDTNHIQYKLINLLSKAHNNLCVVGDDDQSIYKFRGATIENILNFEETYPDAKTIRLEQNYRSTKNILEAANKVIENNEERKGKNLWTDNSQGEKIVSYLLENEREEARYISKTILDNVEIGKKFNEHAVLYRMNAQAASIERDFVKSGIPYRILAGLRFYEHKEIKDIIAYFSVINNQADIIRLKRIINEPKRQIGDTSLNNAIEISEQLNIPLFEALKTADNYSALKRSAPKLMKFAEMIEEFKEFSLNNSINDLFEYIVDKTGYMDMLKSQGLESQKRIENLAELSSMLITYEQENEDANLAGYLEEVTLMTDVDNYDEELDAVIMMTMHSAKGLEFPVVFLPGLEEGIFPGMQAIFNPEQIEEERRLAYVGITRSKEQLYFTQVRNRMIFGSTARNKCSRFIKEIPEELLEQKTSIIPGATIKKDAEPNKRQVIRTTLINSARKFGMGENESESKNNFKPGDNVKHKTFGKGMVINTTKMGNDFLIEIIFEKVGTKKLMANFSNLKKI